MKLVVILLLAAVVLSLFSGLFFLVKDKNKPDSRRMLRSLKIRVALSAALILFLVLSYQLGWISQ
ncbi:MAG: twin transmembrane helix small protein [Woeseiaceae bacterium]